ncbi:MAG: SRPBCC domain-containing protein [Proteobacteria bacterium]|nr:SRPBCC domain-containing protein [Pseudomonadota bacterium]
MANEFRSYALRTDISAPVARVWTAWTQPLSLARWCSPSATIRAKPDGSLRVRFDSAVEIDAHIDVFEPAQRLRLLLLSGSSAPAFDGVEVDDFLFEADGERSRPDCSIQVCPTIRGGITTTRASGYTGNGRWRA